MTDPFSDDDIRNLSLEIDQQLAALASAPVGRELRGEGKRSTALPKPQADAITNATGEDADTFVSRFRRAARRDLCEEGGVLYEQHKKWGDLSNEKVLRSFGAILAAMGFSGGPLQVVAVALAVVVVHLGVKAVCEEG